MDLKVTHTGTCSTIEHDSQSDEQQLYKEYQTSAHIFNCTNLRNAFTGANVSNKTPCHCHSPQAGDHKVAKTETTKSHFNK